MYSITHVRVAYSVRIIVLGRVVAVNWVVPKTQYEEAKLVNVEDSSADDHDEVQSSS